MIVSLWYHDNTVYIWKCNDYRIIFLTVLHIKIRSSFDTKVYWAWFSRLDQLPIVTTQQIKVIGSKIVHNQATFIVSVLKSYSTFVKTYNKLWFDNETYIYHDTNMIEIYNNVTYKLDNSGRE
jgi:hypothetical protein